MTAWCVVNFVKKSRPLCQKFSRIKAQECLEVGKNCLNWLPVLAEIFFSFSEYSVLILWRNFKTFEISSWFFPSNRFLLEDIFVFLENFTNNKKSTSSPFMISLPIIKQFFPKYFYCFEKKRFETSNGTCQKKISKIKESDKSKKWQRWRAQQNDIMDIYSEDN